MEIHTSIVGFEESREIARIWDGELIDIQPVKGSERQFVSIRLPNGEIVRAGLSSEDFDKVSALVGPPLKPSAYIDDPGDV